MSDVPDVPDVRQYMTRVAPHRRARQVASSGNVARHAPKPHVPIDPRSNPWPILQTNRPRLARNAHRALIPLHIAQHECVVVLGVVVQAPSRDTMPLAQGLPLVGAQRPQDLLNACMAEHCGRLGLAQVDTPLFHREWPDLQPLCPAEDLLQPDFAHDKDGVILFDPALQQGELSGARDIATGREGVAISAREAIAISAQEAIAISAQRRQ